MALRMAPLERFNVLIGLQSHVHFASGKIFAAFFRFFLHTEVIIEFTRANSLNPQPPKT